MSRDALLPRIPFAPLALAAGVAIALAVSLLPVPGSAQNEGSGGAIDEQPTMGTVTLQPGANEIGWIVEIANPQVLFDEIAELESIWTWHALDQRWQVAARDVPSSLWTLYRLVPGTGLRLLIKGDSPVRWERSLVPAGGKVELQPGDNFVAWAGRDGWDVNQLAKGIGRQLREIHRHNTGTGKLDRIWPVAEGAEAATVARGEALWVKMPRSIVWLQPTDVWPRLIFPGGAPENMQAAVRRDLRNTLDYFATEYGIQADFAEFSIYLPDDGESLKRQLILDGHTVDDADVERILDSAGAHGFYGVVIRRHEDVGALADISYQRIMTHEYFHRIQSDLENGGNDQAEWIVEGSADYAEWDQQVAASERTWAEIASDSHKTMYDDVPRLVSAEEENNAWEYYLGRVALRRLVERSGSSAWVDFYRELAPTQIGPANRWQSTPPWRDVFASSFDINLNEFYAAFDQWQADLAIRNGPSGWVSEEHARIEGRVVRADGSPVADRFVSANETVVSSSGNRRTIGWQQRAETDAEGNFSVIAPNDGQYVLQIDLGDEQRCSVYYSRESGAYARDDADLLTVSGRTLHNVRFTIAADTCLHELRGTVRGPGGEPLAGIVVQVAHIETDAVAYVRTNAAGDFALKVPRNGGYRIRIDLMDDCRFYFSDGSVTPDRDAMTPVQVRGGDVRVDVRIPGSACRSTISGRLLDASGEPLANVLMTAVSTDVGDSLWLSTDDDGAFSFTVPQDGGYLVRITLAEGCNVHFASDGVTADRDAAATVRVAERNVRGNITIPSGWCEHAISGRLLDASGEPLANVLMAAVPMDVGDWLWLSTDDDGAFSFTVPQDGGYLVLITLVESCLVYHADGGVTADESMASPVRVAGRDVRGDIMVPDGWCEHAISGRLLDASGEPMADVEIVVISGDPPSYQGARTDSTGAFSVAVPQDGGYRIQITLAEGCYMFFASGGVTANYVRASLVRVAGGDVRVGDIRVPAGICDG